MFGHKTILSFILRLWQINETNRSEWHYSLENTSTREIHNFQDLQTLMVYLTQITDKKQVDRELSDKEEK